MVNTSYRPLAPRWARTRMAPSYANLFMGKFEQLAIENAPLKPFVWWRYIDDIFMIWTEGEDSLKTFINDINSILFDINSIHPTKVHPRVLKFFKPVTSFPRRTSPP